MLVLALDTSSPAVTAALLTLDERTGGSVAASITVLAARAPVAARGHGELLAPAITDCLTEAGVVPADVDAVVAGTGPGPFTGLRVGLVTAAAFAHAVAAPTYGVCSLDGIGADHPDEPALLVVTDARRHEVYWARYRHGVRVDGPGVAAPAEVPIDGVSAVIGGGTAMYSWPGPPVLDQAFPGPVALVGCAATRILERAPGGLLRPRYLRRPDAVVPGAPKHVTR